MKINDHGLNYIASIVAERPNLIILTDEVYCMFADQFVSLFAICPKNTILVYSYSKYFGATGWRLGVIGIHHDNVFDVQIAALPTEKRRALHARYKSIKTESDSFKFIDRLVADSRLVALNHTSGLSTPQQVQMVLFSLFARIDTSESYKTVLKQLIRHRKRALYRAIDMDLGDYEDDVNAVSYYVILDLDQLCQRIHSRKFANWLLSRTNTIELLLRLARESHVVLMSAHGFGVQHPSVRVSLANVNEVDYKRIGQAVRTLIEENVEKFNAENPDDLLVKGEVVVYSEEYCHSNDA
jgi:aspartate 4-decarboxylase